MQDYISFAEKNGVTLFDKGACQFCGAKTTCGVHECLEIFNLGFEHLDFAKPESHRYRFLIVDAHALQHPEIHGRWSNHFHLSRLHLIFKYHIKWTYNLSPQLSDLLNKYKNQQKEEFLTPPEVLKRGEITSKEVKESSGNELNCKTMIEKWASETYKAWVAHHQVVDAIAREFLNIKV